MRFRRIVRVRRSDVAGCPVLTGCPVRAYPVAVCPSRGGLDFCHPRCPGRCFRTVFNRVADFPVWQSAAVGTVQGAVSITSISSLRLKRSLPMLPRPPSLRFHYKHLKSEIETGMVTASASSPVSFHYKHLKSEIETFHRNRGTIPNFEFPLQASQV